MTYCFSSSGYSVGAPPGLKHCGEQRTAAPSLRRQHKAVHDESCKSRQQMSVQEACMLVSECNVAS